MLRTLRIMADSSRAAPMSDGGDDPQPNSDIQSIFPVGFTSLRMFALFVPRYCSTFKGCSCIARGIVIKRVHLRDTEGRTSHAMMELQLDVRPLLCKYAAYPCKLAWVIWHMQQL